MKGAAFAKTGPCPLPGRSARRPGWRVAHGLFAALFFFAAFAPGFAAPRTVAQAASTTSTLRPAARAPRERTADRAARRPTVSVAFLTDFAPYEFLDENGEPDGYAMDILRQAAMRLGMQVEFVPCAGEAEALAALREGRAQIRALFFVSAARRDEFFFARPWGSAESAIFVIQSAPYDSLDDLLGRPVAAIRSSVEEETLRREARVEVAVVENAVAALEALSDGSASGAALNREVANYEIARNPILRGRFRALAPAYLHVDYAVASLPENHYLASTITSQIEDLKEEGAVLEGLHMSWFLRHSEDYLRRNERNRILQSLAAAGLFLIAALAILASFSGRRRKRQLEILVERRAAELTRSERHYRALFDFARDAIVLFHPEDRVIIEINPGAERLFGKPREEILGRRVEELIEPGEEGKAIELIRRQALRPDGSEMAHITLNAMRGGAPVIAHMRLALVDLDDAMTIYAVFRDVTESMRSREALEQRNKELRLQNALALALQRDLPLGQRLAAGLDALLHLQVFHLSRRGAIFLLTQDRQAFVLTVLRGLECEGMKSIEDEELAGLRRAAWRVPKEKAPLLQRAAEGEIVYVECWRDTPFPIEPPPELPEHGHYILPLRAEGGRVNGVLTLFTEPHAPNDERRRALLEGIGAQLGIVLESEIKEQALRERERRLQSLYEIAISLGVSLDLTQQLKALFVQIRRVMPADAGNLWVADAGPFRSHAEVYYSFDTGEDGRLVESFERRATEITEGAQAHRVFTSGEPLLILRSEEEIAGMTVDSTFGTKRLSRSLLYVPLRFKQRVIGVLTVQSYLAGAYSQETIDLLMSLSAPLAVVIENARLFETVEQRRAELDKSLKLIESDLRAAQAAQESLLPREFPAIEGWEFGAIFVPSQYVGGDFYNVFRLDEEYIGLYHIDVSGHGVPAALFSVGINQYLMRDLLGPGVLRAETGIPGRLRVRSPEEMISLLDQENMFQRHQHFFTMLYLTLNVRTGLVRFYRAGHTEPLLLRPGQPPRYLEGGGSLIGFQMPRNPDEMREIQLQPGDRLIIYSDGVNEACNAAKEEFGFDRLAQFLASRDEAPLSEAFSALLQEIRRFTGHEEFEDDVSMTGIRWLGPGAGGGAAGAPR